MFLRMVKVRANMNMHPEVAHGDVHPDSQSDCSATPGANHLQKQGGYDGRLMEAGQASSEFHSS